MQPVSDTKAGSNPNAGPSPFRIPLLAVAAGLAVGNVYAAQPLLGAMAADLSIDAAGIGLVVTVTQVGYGLGLIGVVPLGDLVDRRRLILTQGLLSAIALVCIATAHTRGVLLAGMAAMGLMAVAAQLLVAFAALLAAPEARGRAVGMVTSGIVIGILGARVVAGLLADIGGWRSVYLVSAMFTLAMVAAMRRVLPPQKGPDNDRGYAATLRSVPMLFLGDRVLLVRGLLALFLFASFSTFWTALALPLGSPPFSYSPMQIGLFGLVGVAGALAASGAGRLADRGLARWTTGLSLTILVLSWGLIACLPTSLVALVIGVILLDLAVQAVHVTNQSLIMARHLGASSRIVGGYMIFYSIGSGIGAIGATALYSRYGWHGVCALGAAFAVAALMLWASTVRALAKRDAKPARDTCPRNGAVK
jgi:predicted MFS family arabinose efflux permease